MKQEMKIKTMRRATLLLLALCVLASGIMSATAQTRERTTSAQRIDSKTLREATRRSATAAKVFNEIMSAPDSAIPSELLQRAQAIAVFPDVRRAAFGIGGRFGDGVIARRTASGWSAPAFFSLGGASFGLQIGASSTDFVMLFMNEGALKGLLEDKFEIGGDVSVAAGPVGRTAGAGTNLTLDAGLLSYSRSKGLFAGAAIKGVVFNAQNDFNNKVYNGKDARDILGATPVTINQAPRAVRAFPQALTRYSS